MISTGLALLFLLAWIIQLDRKVERLEKERWLE